MAKLDGGCAGCKGVDDCGGECYPGRSCSDAEAEAWDALEDFRVKWAKDFQAELERLQKRVADLEEQNLMHASREICAAMTRITSFEKHVLGRELTTSQLKKIGMEMLGMGKE